MTIREAVPGDIIPRTEAEEAEYQKAQAHQRWLDDGAEVNVQLLVAMLSTISNDRDYQHAILHEAHERVTACDYGGLRSVWHIQGLWNSGYFVRQRPIDRGVIERHIALQLCRHDCGPMHDATTGLLRLDRNPINL